MGQSGAILSSLGARAVISVASPVTEHRLPAHGLQELQHAGSVVMALGL